MIRIDNRILLEEYTKLLQDMERMRKLMQNEIAMFIRIRGVESEMACIEGEVSEVRLRMSYNKLRMIQSSWRKAKEKYYKGKEDDR